MASMLSDIHQKKNCREIQLLHWYQCPSNLRKGSPCRARCSSGMTVSNRGTSASSMGSHTGCMSQIPISATARTTAVRGRSSARYRTAPMVISNKPGAQKVMTCAASPPGGESVLLPSGNTTSTVPTSTRRIAPAVTQRESSLDCAVAGKLMGEFYSVVRRLLNQGVRDGIAFAMYPREHSCRPYVALASRFRPQTISRQALRLRRRLWGSR